MTRPIRIVTLCTGNAARSVMASFVLEAYAAERGIEVEVVGAGTHAIEGQPMSVRTKAAIEAVPRIGSPALGRHRSHQLTEADVAWADVVVAMERDHLRYVRRIHGDLGAAKTTTLPELDRCLPQGAAPLADRIAALRLVDVALDHLGEVDDPAGGDPAVYVACALQIAAHLDRVLERLAEE